MQLERLLQLALNNAYILKTKWNMTNFSMTVICYHRGCSKKCAPGSEDNLVREALKMFWAKTALPVRVVKIHSKLTTLKEIKIFWRLSSGMLLKWGVSITLDVDPGYKTSVLFIMAIIFFTCQINSTNFFATRKYIWGTTLLERS